MKKKLFLNKQTITQLNHLQKVQIKGGADTNIDCDQDPSDGGCGGGGTHGYCYLTETSPAWTCPNVNSADPAFGCNTEEPCFLTDGCN